MLNLTKEIVIKYVRPFVIPVFRGYIRYFPVHLGKTFLWDVCVGPYLQCADFAFTATTLDGGKIAGNTSDMIQRFIYYFGVWEPSVTAWLRTRLKPGDTFVDVGANIGYYSILASSLVGERGKVVAVEASPSIFRSLVANLERNGLRNVRAVNLAVSNRKGKVAVYRAGEGNIGETSIFQGEGRSFETEVDSLPLDLIPLPEERGSLGVVKIDVEGAEYLVLDGMRNLLAECTGLDVVVEVDPGRLRNHNHAPEDIFRLFEKAGYRAYVLENSYDPLSYLSSLRGSAPTPFRGPVDRQIEVIFTKERLEHASTQ